MSALKNDGVLHREGIIGLGQTLSTYRSTVGFKMLA